MIFDLDGTLADTLEDIGVSMNEALRNLGQPTHPLDAYREFVGEGVVRLAQSALPPQRQDLVEQAVAGFRAHYAAHIVDHTRAFAGVPELLEALAARGVKLAVLSNKLDEMTKRIAELCFSRWRVWPVFGERPGVPKKPDPASALEISSLWGVPAREIAFVGDTAVDMETARNAGMFGVGVLWGFRPREEMEAGGARAIAATPEELLRILGQPAP